MTMSRATIGYVNESPDGNWTGHRLIAELLKLSPEDLNKEIHLSTGADWAYLNPHWIDVGEDCIEVISAPDPEDDDE